MIIATVGTHVSFIFEGVISYNHYNPYFWGLTPSFFMLLGSKGRLFIWTFFLFMQYLVWFLCI